MDEIMQGQTVAPVAAVPVRRVDRQRLMEIRAVHNRYCSGLKPTYRRVIADEEWYRLHNTIREQADGKVEVGKDGGFTAQSAWVFNTVTSKHADHVDACPTAEFLPREPGDVQTAETLGRVVPYLLERFKWTETWNMGSLRKVKLGTGVYKVLWDKNKEGGLGEVSILSVSVLNLAWEPTATDIQEGGYFFHHEYVDNQVLSQMYPDKFPAEGGVASADYAEEFLPDQERRDKTGKSLMVECWYKIPVSTGVGSIRKVLHKVVYVGDTILYASEDDPKCAERGYYDHGLYPYVFDPMFRVEDSACGLSYVDIGVNPQIAIDILNTAFVKNAAVGAIPRYMSADKENTIDEQELLDTSKPIVHVKGSINEQVLREMPHKSLDGNYIAFRDGLIQEMRETTGNTETSTGNSGSGVTAASAIAALQEASGKISRAAISASYGAFAKIMEQVVELIRQFYTVPRYARITGTDGKLEFTQLSTAALTPGGRKATFDISIKATKLRSFDRVAHNELALQFYGLGFFDPARAEQALMCIDMMDFPGKDTLRQRIAKQAKMHQAMVKFMQLALALAQKYEPAMAQVIGQEIMAVMGQEAGAQMGVQPASISGGESAVTANARRQAQSAAMPG